MISILRWFFGWSEFSLQGSENNFLTHFKDRVWMVRKINKTTTVRCMTKDFKTLEESSVDFGCLVLKIKDSGFLNFLKKYKFRFGLFVGLLVFLLANLISSFFVWDVEIIGNALVTDEQIFKICDENGLHFGGFIFKINERDIEHKIKEKYSQISWISLNRIAGKYIIEVSESKKKPNIVDWHGPCDVISQFDGEILYIEAYSGLPLVGVGDFVKKGQILVTGVQAVEGLDNVIYSHSDAKILAKVKQHNEISIKKNSLIEQTTGLQKQDKFLILFGLKIPLKLNKKSDSLVKSDETFKPLEFLGLRFPILIDTITYDVYEKVNLKEDVRNIKRILANKQKKWEEKELMGNIILNREYKFEEKDDYVKLNADVLVEQRVDEKAPINLEIEDYVKNEKKEV